MLINIFASFRGWGVLPFVLFALLLTPGCSKSGATKFDSNKPSAKIAALDGDVQFKKSGSANWAQAILNQMMYPLQTLKTLNENGKKGSLVLVFIDNSRLSLEPGSTLEIAKIAQNSEHQSFFDISVKVLNGLTLFEVEHKEKKREFVVETESAITAVTGTIFSVEVKADGSTRVVVKEGMVNVTGKGISVSVKSSMETIVKKAGAPTPPAVLNLKGEKIFQKNLSTANLK